MPAEHLRSPAMEARDDVLAPTIFAEDPDWNSPSGSGGWRLCTDDEGTEVGKSVIEKARVARVVVSNAEGSDVSNEVAVKAGW